MCHNYFCLTSDGILYKFIWKSCDVNHNPTNNTKNTQKSTPLGMMGKNRRTDDRRSVKLTWAFSSDELKTKDCVYCFYILKNIALCIKYCKYCFWTLLRNMFCAWGIYQWNWTTCLKNLNAFTNQMFKIKLLAMSPPEAGNISRHLSVRFGSIHANEFNFHEKVIKHHYLQWWWWWSGGFINMIVKNRLKRKS